MVGPGHHQPIVSHMHLSNLHKVTFSSWTWTIGEKMEPAGDFENLPLLLNRCGLERGLPACLSEHRLGFRPSFSLSRMSLTHTILSRGPGQGQGVEISRRSVLKSIGFYLPPLSQGGGGGVGKPG